MQRKTHFTISFSHPLFLSTFISQISDFCSSSFFWSSCILTSQSWQVASCARADKESSSRRLWFCQVALAQGPLATVESSGRAHTRLSLPAKPRFISATVVPCGSVDIVDSIRVDVSWPAGEGRPDAPPLVPRVCLAPMVLLSPLCGTRSWGGKTGRFVHLWSCSDMAVLWCRSMLMQALCGSDSLSNLLTFSPKQ